MNFSGEYRIPGSQQRVWNALSDPAVMQACIAGCSRVEKRSDSEMVATVAVTVGPICATFKGDVSLSDLSGPIGYSLMGENGATCLAKVEAHISLAEDRGETILKYVATADMDGQFASVGGWLAQTVARINADEFFAAFARHLSAPRVRRPVMPVGAPPLSIEAPAITAERATASSAPGAPIPGWLVVLAVCLALVLGYFFGRFA